MPRWASSHGRLASRPVLRNHPCGRSRSATLPRLIVVLVIVLSFAASAGATTMKATAPEKMMPSGGGEAMRECDKLAMQQNIRTEDRARFVKECVAKKMK
jgi:hypothetical protein